MSNQEQTFDPTLEAKLATILADAEADDYDLLVDVLAYRVLPNDILKSIFVTLPWFDESKFTDLYMDSVGKLPSTGVFSFDEINKVFEAMGLVDIDINGYFAYKQDADDTNIRPLSDGSYIVNFSEELGFIDYGSFLVSRTSSPAILMSDKGTGEGPKAVGVTAVNVWLVCPSRNLKLDSEFADDVWGPVGVEVTASIAGGNVYTGMFDAGILNSYACDILGIPYNEGDLVLIPISCPADDLFVTDSENNAVPLLLPVEEDAS